ncbi:MAG: 23S rRNA (cytidine(2498)-2'-O)-methyltransferase RlmM [Zoogloeaceae bacterium]|nr:23S rRNA (cytidine(2498)-2'-O)-methyltransferase RlmM [Rhodocyclaceae bacterium]MCP5234972.1 23S rRNA (cytidine(2498)-2'-O)-methyltransferase RlmM [Zoogloeaceae bacterium]
MKPAPAHVDCRFVMALCRPGFETECSGELMARLDHAGINGRSVGSLDSGQVRVDLDNIHRFELLDRAIRLVSLTFSRQLAFGFGHADGLAGKDRVSPLLDAAKQAGTPFSAILVEAGDGAEQRPLAALGRRLEPALVRAFAKYSVLRPRRTELARLHIHLPAPGSAWLGLSAADNASPWSMGIPRLRMPSQAPSRSTLKLVEAFMTLLTPAELELTMRAGQRAVDLGAAPGGWSWHLANRGLRVTAIDNGPMAPQALATGMIEHVRADGFTWRPDGSVDWLVCDMVEQPARISRLVADWVASGRARRAIFNLKLPMKKRLEELERCRRLIDDRFRQASLGFDLRMRQLYHDREEVTAYLAPR